MTLNLAFPQAGSNKKSIGTSKAEVITALCSMIHSPLSKTNPVAFASVQNIVDAVTNSEFLYEKAQAIAQLFLDRANPSIPVSQRAEHDLACDERAKALYTSIAG